MVRQRVRIRFCKQGDLRLIGHRDLMRCLERLFRRAGLALGMSEGFHPKPRMTFPSALAVGIEGIDEVMEFELAEPLAAAELLRRLAAAGPAGTGDRRGGSAAAGAAARPACEASATRCPFPPHCRAGLERAHRPLLAPRVLARSSAAGGRRSIDLRSCCKSWRCDEGVLRDAACGRAAEAAPARATCWPPWAWPISSSRAFA